MDSNENNERFCEYERVPLFLGCKEIMGLLGLSRTTVYGLLQSEAFPTITVGKRRLVRKENLFEWISTHEKVMKQKGGRLYETEKAGESFVSKEHGSW